MRAYGQNNAQTCRIKVTVPSWVCRWEKASCRLSENCTAASTNTPRCLLLGRPRAPSVSPHVAPVPLQASLNPVPSWGAPGLSPRGCVRVHVQTCFHARSSYVARDRRGRSGGLQTRDRTLQASWSRAFFPSAKHLDYNFLSVSINTHLYGYNIKDFLKLHVMM